MKKIELACNTIRRRYPRWLHLILAAMMVLGFGMAQGLAAPNNNNGKKPIPSKAAKKAALKAAAAAFSWHLPGRRTKPRSRTITDLSRTGPTARLRCPTSP